jgi:hypothetical protein
VRGSQWQNRNDEQPVNRPILCAPETTLSFMNNRAFLR